MVGALRRAPSQRVEGLLHRWTALAFFVTRCRRGGRCKEEQLLRTPSPSAPAQAIFAADQGDAQVMTTWSRATPGVPSTAAAAKCAYMYSEKLTLSRDLAGAGLVKAKISLSKAAKAAAHP